MLTNFNVWYAAQSGPFQIGLITVAGALCVGLLGAFINFVVAQIQRNSALRSVAAQERTIYLSLLERRAKWLDHAVETWGSWIAQQEERVEAILKNQLPLSDGALRELGQSRREARWLFGPEVDAHLEQLEVAIRVYSEKRMAVREIGMMEPAERRESGRHNRHAEYQQSLLDMMKLQGGLTDSVRPYLYVGDIKAEGIPARLDQAGTAF